MRRVAILTLLTSGCLAGQLKPHTLDHAQQTTAVCRVCEHVEGACSETVTADVCESATQAQRIDDITHGREP